MQANVGRASSDSKASGVQPHRAELHDCRPAAHPHLRIVCCLHAQLSCGHERGVGNRHAPAARVAPRVAKSAHLQG